jgi:glucose-6-phosphate dehydrogenase assembly protein OpcA
MSGQSGPAERTAVEEFLSGKLAQVNVQAIERELRKLWQEAAEHESESSGKNVARACVLNLILYTRDHGSELSAGNVLGQVMLSHPCRALLAIAADGAVPQVEAWVSARCHLAGPGSTKQICCEQISVKAVGQDAQALPSAVLPLLVPDLPVYLWWRTSQFERQSLSPFVPAVDRLIFDSLGWTKERTFFQEAATYVNGGVSVAMSDLNWGRLLHWRRLIAKAFDSLGIGLAPADLPAIESVRLDCSAPGRAQAALLTGWLANQLQWQPLSAVSAGGKDSILFSNRTGGEVQVEWNDCSRAAVPAGNLACVYFNLTEARKLSVCLSLLDGKFNLLTSLHSASSASREIMGRGPILNESELVGRELDAVGHDSVFEGALKMSASICTLFGSEEGHG